MRRYDGITTADSFLDLYDSISETRNDIHQRLPINCKYTDCVEVCPLDCFYEGENMLVIHPDDASIAGL